MHSRGPGAAELLDAVRVNPDLLITDPSRELCAFRLTQITPLGSKRGTGRGGFIDSMVDAVDTFYENVVQSLRSWSAPAPRLRDEPETTDTGVPPALVSAGLSSQDDPELATERPAPPTPSVTASPRYDGDGPDVEHVAAHRVHLTEPPGAAPVDVPADNEPADEPTPPAPTPPSRGLERSDASWSSLAPAANLVRPLPGRSS